MQNGPQQVAPRAIDIDEPSRLKPSHLVGGLVMLILTSPRLAGYTLIGIPMVVLPVIIVGRYIRKLSRQSQDRVADTSGLAGETLNAMQTIQSFTLEDLQIRRYGQAVTTSFMTAVRHR